MVQLEEVGQFLSLGGDVGGVSTQVPFVNGLMEVISEDCC